MKEARRKVRAASAKQGNRNAIQGSTAVQQYSLCKVLELLPLHGPWQAVHHHTRAWHHLRGHGGQAGGTHTQQARQSTRQVNKQQAASRHLRRGQQQTKP